MEGQSTFDSLDAEAPPRVGAARVTGLTVLYHPRLERVGERALLTDLDAGRTVELSRLVPLFACPGGDAPRPLAHRSISRRPLELTPAGDELRLRRRASSTRVVAGGEHLDEELVFDRGTLERGVVLRFGSRIVLLLHRLLPHGDAPAPDHGLLGESAPMVALRRDLRRVAPLDVPVLLRGETGTGKELTAAALHRASTRCERPFVAVNAAAIPPALAATELFGAARGAFTGADRRRDGYFARADGGTLFLDEIGEMPVEVQALLLRCLESGEIQPVGEAGGRRVDVRLIAATDADLEAAVAAGTFRAPLLHRLDGFRLVLPPLRARREDIGRLFVAFLRRELEAIGETRRLEADPPWVPAELVARLVEHPWPGNVRELRNAVRHLVITHRDAERIEPGLRLPSLVATTEPAAMPATTSEAGSERAPTPSAERLGASRRRRPADIGEDELIAALSAARWRPHAAARALGIPRPSIYHLMKKCRRVRLAADLEQADVEAAWRRLEGDVPALAAELEISERALRRRLRELGFL